MVLSPTSFKIDDKLLSHPEKSNILNKNVITFNFYVFHRRFIYYGT